MENERHTRRRLVRLGSALVVAGAVESTGARALAATGRTPPFSVDIRSFGARGDGRHDDAPAIRRAYASVPDGGTLHIPPGNFLCRTPLHLTRRVNVAGSGTASVLALSVGQLHDGIVFGHAKGLTYGITVRDLFVTGSGASVRDAVVFLNLGASIVDNVWIKAGTAKGRYGASVRGCLMCTFAISMSVNTLLPHERGWISENGVQVVGSDVQPSNANVFHCILEGTLGTALEGNAGIGAGGVFNNVITGTYEGNKRGIVLNGWNEFAIREIDSEANAISLTNCANGQLGPALYHDGDISITNCKELTLDGVTTNSLTVDSASRIIMRRVQWGIQGGSFRNDSTLPVVDATPTIAVPFPGKTGPDAVRIVGTTPISDITPTYPGHIVALVFADPVTVTPGPRLRLAGTFAATTDSTLTLVCDGQKWLELARRA